MRIPTSTSIILMAFLVAGCVQPQMLVVPGPDPAPSPSQAVGLACDSIVSQLCRYLPTNVEYRLAVKAFDDADGTAKTVQRALMEHLKGDLSVSGHFTVVEDPRMDAIISEAATQETLKGVIDTNTLVDFEHKLIGVDAVLVGNIIDYGSEWGIECRLIPIERGNVVGHASSKISKAGFVSSAERYSPSVEQPTSSTPPTYYNRSSQVYAHPRQYNGGSPVVVPAAPSVQQLQGMLPQ